jgi:hypothetical protein
MRARFGALVLAAVLACSDNSTTEPEEGGGGGSYTIGGSVIGLEGDGLVITNAGNDAISPGIGPFTFPTAMSTGEEYDVVVQTQPTNPPQTCTVQNGNGIVGTSNVTNVVVACA